MPEPAGQIQAAMFDRTVCFRVVGKPNLQRSTQFRLAVEQLLARGVHSFVVELGDCPSIDSTFIGVLLFAWKGARRLAPTAGRVELRNCNDLVCHQIESLGVRDRFTFVTAAELPKVPFEPLSGEPPTPSAITRASLESHRELSQANPENAARFKDVVRFLEEDLRRQ